MSWNAREPVHFADVARLGNASVVQPALKAILTMFALILHITMAHPNIMTLQTLPDQETFA